MVEHPAQVLEVGVEVVVMEVSVLIEAAAVRLAGARVIAHERITRQRLDLFVQRAEQRGGVGVQLAPERVQDHGRMPTRDPDEALVFGSNLVDERAGGARQPHRQLDPQQHAELVRDVEVVLRREPQAQLHAVEAQAPELLEVGPQALRVPIGRKSIRVPAPGQDHARQDRLAVEQDRVPVDGDAPNAERDDASVAAVDVHDRGVADRIGWRPGSGIRDP
jgi:hypothetical protein